jgi:hypothetical protein
MNPWFGPDPWGAVCVGAPHVATPVGAVCLWCDEPILPGDQGQLLPQAQLAGDVEASPLWRPVHRERLLRQVLGSVGHQQGRCSCFGGDEGDPPGMSRREAALAALEYFEARR